jgi:hypothetical protein
MMRKFMALTAVTMMLVAITGVAASAGAAPQEPDVFGEFAKALKTQEGEAFIEWLGGLEPREQPDATGDPESFAGGPPPDGASGDDIVSTADAGVTLPAETTTMIVDACGSELPSGYQVVCPTHSLDPAALTNARVFGTLFDEPLAMGGVCHFVAAGNATARPDVPVRPDQPGNLLSGSDQFLRLQHDPTGGWTYGYYLFNANQFAPFRVNTVALVGDQGVFHIAAAPELDWETFMLFTDAEHPSGIPFGDGTEVRGFSDASGELAFRTVTDAAPAGGSEAPVATSSGGDDDGTPWVPIALTTVGVVVLVTGGVVFVRSRRSAHELDGA